MPWGPCGIIPAAGQWCGVQLFIMSLDPGASCGGFTDILLGQIPGHPLPSPTPSHPPAGEGEIEKEAESWENDSIDIFLL